MKKIITILSVITILFLISFVLQSKYNTAIFNAINVPTPQETILMKQIHLAGTTFLFMNLLIYSIVLCFSIMAIILVFVLFNRRKIERRQKISDKFLIVYQKKLIDYLIDVNKEIPGAREKYIKEFKELSSGGYHKQLLMAQICDLNLTLTGLNNERLKGLYYELGFHKKTYRKVHSPLWYKKIQGFKELYAMNMTEKNDVLMEYINSKNELVGIEAQIALVDLSKENPDVNPFEFLGTLKTDFSLWEQITLHQIMVQRDIRVPDFGQWLNSQNDTVVTFCLRMIREYQQVSNASKIEELLDHKNEKVRKLAIEVLGDIKATESAFPLKKKYKEEVYENSLEIIKSLRKISNPKSIGFLQKVVDSEQDTNLQIEAVKAIAEMGDEGKIYLEKMMKSDYKDYNIIIKHVLDKRIN